MRKYNYSKSEQEIFKVLKYNQKLSNTLLTDYKNLNANVVKQNEIDDKFISMIESKLGINIPNNNPLVFKKTSVSIQVPEWEDLVCEANEHIPYSVGYEDLLTSEDFSNAYKHLDEINEKFSKKTSLKKLDWIFLVTAIAMQCLRQYVLDPWLKKSRPVAGSGDEGNRKGNAEQGWYYVDTKNILINRVPFDAQAYGTANTIQGFLKGGDHRMMTPGHDPLLGWFFGTANILTNTLTRLDLMSAHIKCVPTVRAPLGENVIHSLASTAKILFAVKNRLFDEGWDGKLAVGLSIIREAIHLKSDVGTKRSLPLPIISNCSPDIAKQFVKYGIDTASVATEIGLSTLINTLISIVHRLFYDESMDDNKLFEVRTRKILLYSNTIASTSNIIISALTKNPEIIDVGGLIVSIFRLFSDIRFICMVKQEFIQSELDIHYQGIVDELELMYKI